MARLDARFQLLQDRVAVDEPSHHIMRGQLGQAGGRALAFLHLLFEFNGTFARPPRVRLDLDQRGMGGFQAALELVPAGPASAYRLWQSRETVTAASRR